MLQPVNHYVGAPDGNTPPVVVVFRFLPVGDGGEPSAREGEYQGVEGQCGKIGDPVEIPDDRSLRIHIAFLVHDHKLRLGGSVILVGSETDIVPDVGVGDRNQAGSGQRKADILLVSFQAGDPAGSDRFEARIHQEYIRTAVLNMGIVGTDHRGAGLPTDIVCGPFVGFHREVNQVGEGMGCGDGIHVIGLSVTPGSEVTVTDRPGGFQFPGIPRRYIDIEDPVHSGMHPGSGFFGGDYHIIIRASGLSGQRGQNEKNEGTQEQVFHHGSVWLVSKL